MSAARRLATPDLWLRLPIGWRRALVAATLLRVGVALVTVVVPGLLAVGDPVAVPASEGFGGWDPQPATGVGLVGAGLERFDALWYLAIARDGYPTTVDVPAAAAFFPGFPVVTWLVGVLTGGRLLLAGQVVAFGAAVAAFAGVHELARSATARLDVGDPATRPRRCDEVGRRAVVLLAVFPTAFFLVAPYSESLFLATTAWSLVLVRRGQVPAAGLLGLVAGTLRPLGVVLALPLLLAPGVDRRRAAAAAVGPVLGAAAVAGSAWARYGSPTAVLDAQASWQREALAPWTAAVDAVRLAVDGLQAGIGAWALDLVVVVPVLVALGWLLVRDRWLGLYGAAHVVVWFLAPFPDRPLLSVPRFALAVAPLAIVLAVWTRSRTAETVAVAVSAGLLVLHLAVFTTWGLVF